MQEMKRIESDDYSGYMPSYSTDESGLMGEGFNRMLKGLNEREKMRNALGVYVSPQVAGLILNDDLKPGGVRTQAVILFTDLRSFTTMSEGRPPEEVVSLLNEYFTRMVKAIEDEGGYVNKFIGDAVLAVFGAPARLENPDLSAVRSAVRMLESLKELNELNKLHGLPELRMGVGIHRGDVLLGNVGSQHRMEYTVMGDTVNTVSRIESATKKLKHEILISDSVYKSLPENSFSWNGPWQVMLKGKTASMKLYAVKH
jgi:adenylate cyclase